MTRQLLKPRVRGYEKVKHVKSVRIVNNQASVSGENNPANGLKEREKSKKERRKTMNNMKNLGTRKMAE